MTSQDPTDDETTRPQTGADAKDRDYPTSDTPASGRPQPEISSEKKRDGWDYAKFLAELIGLLFLIAYTFYTARIYCANRKAADAAQRTLVEIQQQTKLMRQQLVGTQAAVINIDIPVSTSLPPPLGNDISISIGFKNNGRVMAKNFQVKVSAQVLSLADNTYWGHQWSCERDINVVPPFPPSDQAPNPGEHPFLLCPIDGLTNEDLRSISELKRTIAIDGTYTYDNGFGEETEQRICLRFAPAVRTGYGAGTEGSDNFQECGTFNVERQIILNHLHKHR